MELEDQAGVEVEHKEEKDAIVKMYDMQKQRY